MFIVISFLKTPKRPNVPRPKVPNRGIFNHFHSTLFSAFLDRKIPLKNGCFLFFVPLHCQYEGEK